MTRHATGLEPLASPPSRTTTADDWLTVPPASAPPATRRRSTEQVRGPAPGPATAEHGSAPDAARSSAPSQRLPQVVVSSSARTSTAAACALALGVAGLVSTLSVLLAPLGIVLGAGGLILGVVGTGRAGAPHLTGRGVSVGGIVTGATALLLGIALVAGALSVWSGDGALEFERRLGGVDIEVRR